MPKIWLLPILLQINLQMRQNHLIMYSGQSSIETLENYTQSVDIPSYFYTPLIYGLASMLAAQYAPEKEEGLKIRYQETLNPAVINNTTEVPLKLEVYGN